MHGLSAKVSRYLSPTVKIPSHTQDQEHQHGTCAAELPGICNVNLVSDTMDDGIQPSAWSRGVSKPEKPTQGALPAQSALCLRRNPRISPQAWGTLRGQVHLGSAFRA